MKLTQKAMATLEERFEYLPNLEKWFVLIYPFLLDFWDHHFAGTALLATP